MEQYRKENLIRGLKTGKLAVIQSADAPISRNCIWLKDGVLYAYSNSGWEPLGEAAVAADSLLPLKMTDYVLQDQREQYSNKWFTAIIPSVLDTTVAIHYNQHSEHDENPDDTSIQTGTRLEPGTLEELQSIYNNSWNGPSKAAFDFLVEEYGQPVQVWNSRTYANKAGTPRVIILEKNGEYTAVATFMHWETINVIISNGEVPLQESDPLGGVN